MAETATSVGGGLAPGAEARLSDGRLSRAALARRYDVRFKAPCGVLVALDIESVDGVKQLIQLTTRVDGVAGYKLGLTVVLRLGLGEAVRQLRAVTDLPLIYDHQKAGPDVPDMAVKFSATCREAGVDGLILFPTAGPRAVTGFVGEALRQRLLPIVGGDLPFPDYNASGGGYVVDNALDLIFAKALELGADHFVVPGNTVEKLVHHAAWLRTKLERPVFVVPGIGPLGGTLRSAVRAAAGCDVYGVVGRAIYAAPDPAEAARRIAAEALDAA